MPPTAAQTLQARLTQELGDVDALYTPTQTVRAQTVHTRPPSQSFPTLGADIEVLGRLGHGGSGVVEAVRETSLGRTVAIKRVHAPEDDAAVATLTREAEVTARLNHPSIVPVHRLFHDPEAGPVVVMSLLEGHSWQEGFAWDVDASVKVAIEVAQVLEYAHNQGIFHLDIKPENVFLGAYGAVHLIDWGIAMDTDTEPVRTTIRGTPAFMAPEMTTPERGRIGPHTDVYLLAATLFTVLFQRPPHLRATIFASMSAATEPVAIPDHPDVSARLRAVLDKALSVEPDDRQPTAAAFREDLEAYLKDTDADRLAENIERDHLALAGHPALPRRIELLHRATAVLEVWPVHAPTSQLRQTMARELLKHAIEQHDPVTTSLAADLLRQRGEDQTLIEEADALKHDMELAAARRRALREKQDVAGSPQQRKTLLRFVWVVAMSFPVLAFALQPGDAPNPPITLLLLSLLFLGLLLTGSGLLWKRVQASWALRESVITLVLLGVLVTANRAVSVAVGLDAVSTIRADLLLITAVLLVRRDLHRAFALAGGFTGVLLVAAVVEPGLSRLAMNLAPVAAAGTLLFGWDPLTPRKKRAAARGGSSDAQPP